jgi:hypothetical protein
MALKIHEFLDSDDVTVFENAISMEVEVAMVRCVIGFDPVGKLCQLIVQWTNE